MYLEKLSQAREAKPSENLADAKKPANESKKSTPANESKKSTKELKQCKVLATKDTAKQSAGARKSTKELRQDAKLVALLRSAVADTQDDSGWSELGQIGISLSNQAWFNPRNYGYAKLSGLIKAIDLFEVQRKDKTVFVRNRQKSSVSKALSA
ncbi:MAG: OST-HTH/LOTUS domain-containing protein [Myxacorys chilensis ATA2-1-KO14]|nr:OST-HTH/LOTUS domain-containing protein [Myxacorys chilensis ATA2-1-KO14]